MSEFPVTFGGYDRARVDAFVASTTAALASGDPARRAEALAAANAVSFPSATWRGYDKAAVDHYLRRIGKGRPDDRA
ncbi:DivIVA domain-containing protein [Dactylosporangium aurantiacum]|uniref:DivIVA domain-containing protein n=1 Tax=Dactylosporangium aurantiacum TaxID=35754 RepID=A0A9Q9MDZ6_9ACTN|nr:DivIVA domain-containing protein [Dactylosporangium aurantiacum]MDG6101493.1 DivIVA domain-containing protein [Dactylosporangium aurantiacum]UWZ52659.1 DivIVA domain-containing protein [Dactylosporangium aurantiacum]